MAVCARVKWLERAACESGAHHPPRREHGPPPALACMGGGGGGCVGAVDAMGCVALAMAIIQLYDAAAGSRGGPIARTDRRGPTRRSCHSPTDRRAQRRWGGMHAACHERGWWQTTRWCSTDASGPPVGSAVCPGARPRVRPPRQCGMGARTAAPAEKTNKTCCPTRFWHANGLFATDRPA